MQDVDDEDYHCWTEACEGQRNCSGICENSEVRKVSTRELRKQVLSQNESCVDICAHCEQERNEKSKKLFSDLQTRSDRGPHR